MAVLLVRFGFLAWTRQSITTISTDVVYKVAHTLAMILTLVLTSYSLSRVKIDRTPLVSWQKSPAPLLSQRQYSCPDSSGEPQSGSLSCGSRPEALVRQPFPISSLAMGSKGKIWQAPTPHLTTNTMPWNGSRHNPFAPDLRFPKPRDPQCHRLSMAPCRRSQRIDCFIPSLSGMLIRRRRLVLRQAFLTKEIGF